jgi:hypothetical protein
MPPLYRGFNPPLRIRIKIKTPMTNFSMYFLVSDFFLYLFSLRNQFVHLLGAFIVMGLVIWSSGCGKVESETLSEEALSELEGEWITSCYEVSSLYVLRRAVISNNRVRLLSEFHTDENCSSDYYTDEENDTSLEEGSEVILSDGSSARRYTINLQSLKITPQSSTVVSILNSSSFCGFSDWALNIPKDYTGLTCNEVAYPPKNTMYFGLYKVVGNNAFLGRARTDGTYPTSVSTDTIYVKQ